MNVKITKWSIADTGNPTVTLWNEISIDRDHFLMSELMEWVYNQSIKMEGITNPLFWSVEIDNHIYPMSSLLDEYATSIML